MAYTNPTFVNGSQPPINAQNLNEMADAIESLGVENGGTGQQSFSEGGILLGNGTDPVSELVGTGAVFAQNSGSPQMGTLPVNCGGTGTNTLSALKDALGLTNSGFVVTSEQPEDKTKLWINSENSTMNYWNGSEWTAIRGVFGA